MKAYRFAWLGAWMLLPFLLAAPSHAAVIFSDNFNDGDTVGWTFIGNDAGEWGNTGTQLNSSTGVNDTHDASLGIAYITGVTIPVDGGTKAGGGWFWSPAERRFVNRPRAL